MVPRRVMPNVWTPRILSRLAAVTLVGVLFAMAGVTLYTVYADRQAERELAHLDELAHAYARANAEFMKSQLAAIDIIGVPTAESVEVYRLRYLAAVAALDELIRIGEPEDVELATEMKSHYVPMSEAYIAIVEDALAADVEDRSEFIIAATVARFSEPDMLAHLFYVPDGATIQTPAATVSWDKYVQSLEHFSAQKTGEVAALSAAHEERQTRNATLLVFMEGSGVLLALISLWGIRVFGRREARAEAELRQLRMAAHTDVLTGLHNRRAFEEQIEQLAGSATNGGEPGLVIVDVDQFKMVNDTWGHDHGDHLLRAVAGIMQEAFGDAATIYRVGGDEFAAIFSAAERDDVCGRAERARELARERLGGVTLSLGVVIGERAVVDAGMLVQAADAAMYEAKMHGRNLVSVYDPASSAAPLFPAARLQAVRDLLLEGDLDAVFQPMWRVDGRSIFAYEALSRPAARYGLAGPQQAFEVAERLGRAAELDRLCLRRILSRASALPPDALLFVNLSPYFLTHHSFDAVALREAVERAGLGAARVVFEVTERSPIPPEFVLPAVSALREQGFRVALDDVGTGANGFDMLRTIPFDFVKVDRQVMLGALDDEKSRAALLAILAFAREAGALAVAEGIENEELLGLVRRLDGGWVQPVRDLVYGMQGFLLGRPAAVFSRPAAHEMPHVA
ncbi:MAG: hypothetical protein Kow0010_07040 [Dehalococcoidia bacterium]